YIGKDTLRVELPSKVNGSAKYAIDVQVPGMIYATVLRAPVEGAAPARINDAKAKSIAGIIRIVRLPYGVGVLAETPWAALEARQALIGDVIWTKTGNAWGFDSDKATAEFAAAARDLKSPASVWDKAGDATGKLVAWHQLIAVDRVLPFADPVRYANAKQRDDIVMRGVELTSYDIPHQLSEQLYRDTGVRTSPLRGVGWTANIFAAEAFLDE